jgi:hypothetical protein
MEKGVVWGKTEGKKRGVIRFCKSHLEYPG